MPSCPREEADHVAAGWHPEQHLDGLLLAHGPEDACAGAAVLDAPFLVAHHSVGGRAEHHVSRVTRAGLGGCSGDGGDGDGPARGPRPSCRSTSSHEDAGGAPRSARSSSGGRQMRPQRIVDAPCGSGAVALALRPNPSPFQIPTRPGSCRYFPEIVIRRTSGITSRGGQRLEPRLAWRRRASRAVPGDVRTRMHSVAVRGASTVVVSWPAAKILSSEDEERRTVHRATSDRMILPGRDNLGPHARSRFIAGMVLLAASAAGLLRGAGLEAGRSTSRRSSPRWRCS